MALVAHGWAAPAAVEPERGSVPEPITRFVEGLAALPGAEYVLAVDAGGERVRGESGGPPGPAMAVIDWARRVAEVSHGRHHDLQDLVLTTDTAFHLVRLVAPPAAGDQRDTGSLWVAVRIDRSRGNLAWSRRALAGLGAPGSVPGSRAITAGPQTSTPSRPSTPPEPFVPSGTPPAPSSALPSEPIEPPSGRAWFTPFSPATGSSSPAPEWRPRRPSAPSSWFSPSSGSGTSSDPSTPGPARPGGPAAGPGTGAFPAAMPAPAGAETRPSDVPPPRRDHRHAATDQGRGSGSSGGSQHERAGAVPEARRSGPVDAADGASSRRLPLTVRQATWWSGRGERADMVELGPPTAPTPIVSAPDLPAARTSIEDRPAPAVPAPREPGSLFASVVVVPPPPSPVPEDDPTEMPAPMPYPTITAPPLEDPDQGSTDTQQEEHGASEDPDPLETAGTADTADTADDDADELPELPQRRPGSHLPAGLPATPRSVPTVRPAAAVAGTAAFTNEPSVLRRLIDGLRRLS